MRALLVLVPAALGCGGHYASPKPKHGGADDDALPRGVMAAALPYAIVDGRTGAAVTDAAFWDAVGAARVVCVGEDHSNPHHHWAQLEVVDHVSAGPPRTWALGMEMVQRPFQAVLDDFAAGRIDAAALRSRTGWEDRWGYDFAMYEPVISLAAKRGGALVALNAARELTKKVVRQGLEALTAEERAGLATDVVLDDVDHRAWFDAIMSGMGEAHGHSETPAPEPAVPEPPATEDVHGAMPEMPSAERVYTVQVLWDETMAESAARWVGAAGKSMVVLAGNGHCHDSAIVRRVARRGVTPVVSVRPIIDDDEGSVAAAILEASNDYLFVMTMPPTPTTPDDVSGS